MPTFTVTIDEIKPIGSGKVCNVTFTHPEKGTSTRKAWADKFEGKEGASMEVETFEQLGKNTDVPEKWVKPTAKSGGFRGGGGAKADPERIALEKQRQEDFKAKWDTDRAEDRTKNAQIIAQVILKEACETARAKAQICQTSIEPNDVAFYAAEFTEIYKDTFCALASGSRSAGGK